MTRINVIDVTLLLDKHLLAELRELKRIPNTVHSGTAKLDGIVPTEYVLGTGHVKFFYDKLKFLKIRYEQLYQECINRGFNVENMWHSDVNELTYVSLWNDFVPDSDACTLNIERILLRFPKKNPKYNRKDISFDEYAKLLATKYSL